MADEANAIGARYPRQVEAVKLHQIPSREQARQSARIAAGPIVIHEIKDRLLAFSNGNENVRSHEVAVDEALVVKPPRLFSQLLDPCALDLDAGAVGRRAKAIAEDFRQRRSW